MPSPARLSVMLTGLILALDHIYIVYANRWAVDTATEIFHFSKSGSYEQTSIFHPLEVS